MRVVMRWQLIVTMAMVLLFGLTSGTHGAVSALLGGAVSMVSAAVFAGMTARHRGTTAGSVLITALKAEAAKIVTMTGLLWLALTLYEDVVAGGLVATFAITVLVFGMALFVTDEAGTAGVEQT
ncbi:ATP synthase subunit I [Nitrosovibrio sp. Nv17]|uniref:ATP synthase subunit I n=1 Tax=Nitrosovibrio sp. Nv17 TaxID=1855339 RepID=UPI00210114DB|nr:ATP synthase subunit I [Nitrosovibrio sp. Nv17]